MKIYPYIDTVTGERVAPRAHLRIEYHLSQDVLIGLLAANVPYYLKTGDEFFDWAHGEQAPDLPKGHVYGLIAERIDEHGVGMTSQLWYEDMDPIEVKARREWATRQVERHWGKQFRAAGPDNVVAALTGT